MKTFEFGFFFVSRFLTVNSISLIEKNSMWVIYYLYHLKWTLVAFVFQRVCTSSKSFNFLVSICS